MGNRDTLEAGNLTSAKCTLDHKHPIVLCKIHDVKASSAKDRDLCFQEDQVKRLRGQKEFLLRKKRRYQMQVETDNLPTLRTLYKRNHSDRAGLGTWGRENVNAEVQ